MRIALVQNENGVTLLEVLIAMLLVSFSLLMLLNMGMIALDGNDWSNKTTTATQMLQEKLEELRGGGYSALTNGSDTADGGVVRSWTVTNAGDHLRQIDVQVTWRDMQARERTNTMTAYVRTDSL